MSAASSPRLRLVPAARAAQPLSPPLARPLVQPLWREVVGARLRYLRRRRELTLVEVTHLATLDLRRQHSALAAPPPGEIRLSA